MIDLRDCLVELHRVFQKGLLPDERFWRWLAVGGSNTRCSVSELSPKYSDDVPELQTHMKFGGMIAKNSQAFD
jgi:hypothetical protein